MLSWGWRIPFLASVVLLLVGWFIRAKVAESPDFERMRAQGDKVEVPALVVLRRYPREVLIVVGGRLAEVTWFYTVVTFAGLLHRHAGHPARHHAGRHRLGRDAGAVHHAAVWRAGRPHRFQVDLHGRRGRHPAVRAHVFSMLQTRDPATVTTAIAVAVGLVYARCTARKAACSRPVPARGALQRHLAGGAGVGRHRRRTGAAGRHVAAGLRRRRPALHCLVPERAGPVAIASAFFMHRPTRFALPAGARRGPPMKPSHLDYYFWLNSDWAYLGADRLGARAAPERGHPLQAGRPARRLRAHRRRAAGPALAGTTGLPRRRAAPLVPQAGHPGQPAPRPYVPERRPGLAPRDRGGPAGAAGGGAARPSFMPSGARTAISRPNPRCARSRLRRGWTPTPCCARRAGRRAALPPVHRRGGRRRRSARRRMSMPASCSGARTGWKCWKRRSRRRDAYPAATRGGICVQPLCDALAQVPRQLRALFRLDIGKSHAQPGHGILHAEGLAMAQQPASPRHGQRHGLIVRRQRNPQIESIALRRMRQALRAQRLQAARRRSPRARAINAPPRSGPAPPRPCPARHG